MASHKNDTITDTINATEILPRWNLNDLYPGQNSKELKQDITKLEQSVATFAKNYEGKIVNLSASKLLIVIQDFETIIAIIIKLQTYASLIYVTNQDMPEVMAFYQ